MSTDWTNRWRDGAAYLSGYPRAFPRHLGATSYGTVSPQQQGLSGCPARAGRNLEQTPREIIVEGLTDTAAAGLSASGASR